MSFEYRNYVINCIITIKQVGEISFKKLFFIFFSHFLKAFDPKTSNKAMRKEKKQ